MSAAKILAFSLGMAFSALADGVVMPPGVPFRVLGDRQSPWWAAEHYWDRRHQDKLHEIMRGSRYYDFVFIGSTHIHHWEGWQRKEDVLHHSRLFAAGRVGTINGAGYCVWREMKRKYRLFNAGMAGDSTQNILWRIDNGELDGYKARGFVVNAGADNPEEPEQVAFGVKTIIERIFELHPLAKVILVPILPRAFNREDARLRHDEAVNAKLKQLADEKKIFWCDFNAQLLDSSGRPKAEMLPDGEALSSKGYGVWREALLPIMSKICK